MISPQLLQQRRRQKQTQPAAGAAEVHGAARLEWVPQLAEDVLKELVGQSVHRDRQDSAHLVRRRKSGDDILVKAERGERKRHSLAGASGARHGERHDSA
eukprot:scaffold11979_cov71-Phaeocystis_antarctica.AAC.3